MPKSCSTLLRLRPPVPASSEPTWEPSSRIWHQPPPVKPLSGSWVLRQTLYVRQDRQYVAFSISDLVGYPNTRDVQVWRSRPLDVERPATYTEAIPLLTTALWELDMAFRGMRISFE